MSKQTDTDVTNGTPNKKKKKQKRSTLKLTTPYRCTICKKYLSDKASLAHHTQTHSPSRRFSCERCRYECKTAKYLARHVRTVHGAGNTAACPVCRGVFKRRSLPSHMRLHTGEKPYVCDVCGKAFSSCYSLSTHKYIHTNEKPFRCSFCEYACRDSSTLRKHEARHMGLEPLYQCSLCDKRVKSKSQLKMHIAEVHLAVDIRKHECGTCGKRFRDKSVLNNHVRVVHERRGRVQCALCGAAVSCAANLPAHMLSHLDVRPYRCTHGGCAKRFKDKSSLKKHLVVHDPALRLPCARCRRLFLRTARLNEHRRARTQRCRQCARSFPNKCALWVHAARAHPAPRAPRRRPRRAGAAPSEDAPAPPALSVEVKLERVDASSDEDDVALADLRANRRPVADASEVGLDRETARAIIQDNRKQLKRVPEEVFDELFIRKTMKKPKVEAKTPKYVDKEKELLSKRRVRGLLQLARRVQAARRVRCARRRYHARLAGLAGRDKTPSKPLKIFSINNNKLEAPAVPPETTAARENETEGASDYTSDGDGNTNEKKETSPEPTPGVRKSNRIRKKKMEHIYEYESEGDDSKRTRKRKKCTKDDDSEEDGDIQNEGCKREGDKVNGKLKINTHQCYVCFQLFAARASLLEHCGSHFAVCSSRRLNKCPFCPHVATRDLPRHVRLRHRLALRLPPRLTHQDRDQDQDQDQDRDQDQNRSGYYYDLGGHAAAPRVDVIPSVADLNKRACVRIDRENRERRDKTLTTTKLVRKGTEWIVTNEKLNFNLEDYLLPEIEEGDVSVKDGGGDDHLSRMQALYRVAKKKGKRMLFPCEECDKVCRTLAALKLHTRRHDPHKKPFKKKVWKHKAERSAVETGRSAVETGRSAVETGRSAVETGRSAVETGPSAVDGVKSTANRAAKPKPVEGRHKCDKQLIEFYENNIRGKDIEFWQFLKIYNKMDRENVSDFADLENRIDFDIHPVGGGVSAVGGGVSAVGGGVSVVGGGVSLVGGEVPVVGGESDRSEKPRRKAKRLGVARKGSGKRSFTKSILSKEQYSKRLEALKSLREKMANAGKGKGLETV